MRKRFPLFWKLYPPFLLIVLIPLLAVSWYADFSMRRFFMDQTATNLEARANLLKDQMTGYLLAEDWKNINILCKRAGQCSETRITVMLSSGRVLGDSEADPNTMENHSDRPEFVKAMSGETGVFTRYSNTLREPMMYLAVPLLEGKKYIGVLRASVSVSAIDRQMEKIHRHISLGGIVVAFLATGASLLFSRRVSRPLEIIREGAEYFANGQLSHRLPVFASKETELLSRTMNDMAASLDERMQMIIRQKNEFEAVLSSMTEGVMALDLEETIISINHTAARMFSRKPSELINRSVQEAIRNPDFHRFIRLAFRDDTPREEDLFFYISGEVVLEARSSALKNARGERIGILIVLNDVTRLRRLENMRKDFAANVSHEIKTPLTAIKGFVETLKTGALNRPEEAARFLGIIEKHTNRLHAIIDDLMKLSLIEQKTNKKEILLENRPLLPILKSARQVCQPMADDKAIQIMLSCEETLSINLNPALIEQAFVNLLDNAVKYSGPGSSIEVEARQTDAEVVISFRDHGIGIAAEHLPRLFERFYRADPSRSRKLGGTGLGLAIVKHIVNAHSGRITVESSPGKGSEFVIHIPQKNFINA
ncbi:MAG: PAS domain-containing protein [Deltaproteobacteria bacterium]|nr:PAS domain-containing protein [Deltaproteobacteria bacterium]